MAVSDRPMNRLARLHRQHREVLLALEAAVKPRRLPPLDLDLGVAAHVAHEVAPLGGDVHDTQVLPDGTIHLCVVDATGNGLLAVRQALTIRDSARVLALDGCPFEELLDRLDAVCRAQESGLLGTVVLARYTPSTGEVAVVTAGHPPALRWRAPGDVVALGAPSRPVGVAGPPRARPQRTRLQVGDLLVLGTDGALVATPEGDHAPGPALDAVPSAERASSGMVAFQRALDRWGAERTMPADELAHRLLPQQRDEDAMVVVLRRCTAPPDRWRERRERARLRVDVSGPTEADVTALRHACGDWLIEEACPPALVDRTLLVLSELASNGVAATQGHLGVDVALSERGIELEVGDDGPGFDLDLALSRAPAGGFGLRVVDELADPLRVAAGPQGTIVRATIAATARPGPR